MKQLLEEAIDFPANPFVVLADFLIVLLIILILSVLQQSMASSGMTKRMAVASLQEQLKQECMQPPPEAQSLRKAYGKEFWQYWVDGDLQRFRFRGDVCFNGRAVSTIPINSRGWQIFTFFGRLLKSRQGDTKHPGHGLYKRVIVEGHVDVSEADDEHAMSVSLARAQSVVQILRGAGVNPALLEASGRGGWDPASLPSKEKTPHQAHLDNRRIDIVIVYSGENALTYLNSEREAHSSQRGATR